MTAHVRKSAVYRAHIVGVSIVGLGVFGTLVGHAVAAWHAIPHGREVIVLAVLLMASEQCPLTFHRHGTRSTVTLSGIFACAMLLRWDIVLVVVVQALASIIDDAVARRSWWKSCFNVAQYTLSLAAASVAYHG